MAEEKHHLIEYANGKSLEEINGTVHVPKGKGFWRTLLAYSGPGALVAVGYIFFNGVIIACDACKLKQMQY